MLDVLSCIPQLPQQAIDDLDIICGIEPTEHDNGLLAAVESDAYEKSRLERTRDALVGEGVDETFSRILLPYIRAAKSLQVIDRYAVKNLGKRSSGTRWFVEKILEESQCKLTLHTDAMHDPSEERSASRAYRELNGRFSSRLLIKTYQPDGGYIFPHDRYMRIKFRGQAEVCLEYSKGLEFFNTNAINQTRSFNCKTSAEYKSVQSELSRLKVSDFA